jgi:hypothetical protein
MIQPARLRRLRNCCATFHVDEQSQVADYELVATQSPGIVEGTQICRSGVAQASSLMTGPAPVSRLF